MNEKNAGTQDSLAYEACQRRGQLCAFGCAIQFPSAIAVIARSRRSQWDSKQITPTFTWQRSFGAASHTGQTNLRDGSRGAIGGLLITFTSYRVYSPQPSHFRPKHATNGPFRVKFNLAAILGISPALITHPQLPTALKDPARQPSFSSRRYRIRCARPARRLAPPRPQLRRSGSLRARTPYLSSSCGHWPPPPRQSICSV